MARTRLVRERDSLARQVRELRGQRNAADARYDDEVRRHTACAEAWLKRGLENQALATERDAMRTERDRARGVLKCEEAKSAFSAFAAGAPPVLEMAAGSFAASTAESWFATAAGAAAGAAFAPQALRTIAPNNINKTNILKRVFIIFSFDFYLAV